MKNAPFSRAWRSLSFAAGVLTTAGVALSGGPAWAENVRVGADVPADFRSLYSAHLGGAHLFDFTLDMKDSRAGYQGELVLEARGLFRRFVGLDAHVTGSGSWISPAMLGLEPHMAVRPQSFSRTYARKEFAAVRDVRYDGSTGLARGYRNGQEQEKVPRAMRFGTLDPMATVALGRRWMTMLKPGDERTLHVYDGKLRYDLRAAVEPPRDLSVGAGRVAVTPVRLDLAPLAGFSKKQLKEVKDGYRAVIYFSNDAAREPVRIELPTSWGAFVVRREGACADMACPEAKASYGAKPTP